MTEERKMLELVASELLDRWPGEWVDRIAPLSIGAVAGSAVTLAGGALVRTLFRRNRTLMWVGALAAIPLGLWILKGATGVGDDGEEEDEELDGKANDDDE